VIIRRGKGGKGREIPLAVEVAAAIDRYLRARKAHRLASDPALWLGDRGKYFSYDGLHKTLAMRAAMGRRNGFSSAPVAAHRGRPVVVQGRLRERPDGRCGLDQTRHAPPLHQGTPSP
jgi:site-specific recombinase XerC